MRTVCERDTAPRGTEKQLIWVEAGGRGLGRPVDAGEPVAHHGNVSEF